MPAIRKINGQNTMVFNTAAANMHHRAAETTRVPTIGGGVPRFVCGPLTM